MIDPILDKSLTRYTLIPTKILEFIEKAVGNDWKRIRLIIDNVEKQSLLDSNSTIPCITISS